MTDELRKVADAANERHDDDPCAVCGHPWIWHEYADRERPNNCGWRDCTCERFQPKAGE